MVYTYSELISRSIELRSSFFKTCKQVINDYPWFNQKKDARITFFTKSFAVLDSITLCFIFGDKYLGKNPWWISIAKQYSLKLPESSIRTAMKDTFDQFVLTACFQLIFSSMESSLRLISKEIDPARYVEMQNSFDSIYSSLFRTLIKNKRRKKRYLKLMDILRLVRNTIHNNGVYCPTPKRNKPPPHSRQITWKGVTCKFTVNRIVKVDNFWELVFRTAADILPIMKEIISSTVKIPGVHILINDPSVDKALIPVFFPEK